MADPLAVTTTLNKMYLPVTNTQQLVYALVEVQPQDIISRSRMGLNFGFVLDHSGSMRGDKIDRLRDAVQLALSKMASDDLVSLTIFNDSADTIADAAPLANQGNLADKIRRIRAGGGTQMSRGMSLGLREVYRQFSAEKVNKVLLFTDGQTYGDEAQCTRLAKEAGEHHIPIMALGLGDDWNEKLLDEVGALSGGDADQIASPDEIVPLFTQTVESSQKAVLRNAQMVVRLVSGVTPRQVWQVTPVISNLGYSPIGESDVQVELGEMDAVTGKAVLVELLVPPHQPGRYRIAQTQVTCDLPVQNITGASVRGDIIVFYSGNPSETQTYDARVMNLVERVTAYKLQTRALSDAQAGDIAGATQKLRAAATRLLELGETELAQAAQQEANNLEQTGQMSASGTKKLHYQTRKLTQRLTDNS
ncbi:MAG: VWA domain-containing protein [Chloroflexi bacterium]|nr:VWA domain-containing protein [Chloroflexota bacterium]